MTRIDPARRARTRRLLVLGVAALLASPAAATSVRRLSLSDMTAKAIHVVHARAVANEVTLDENDGYYYTVTRFEVVEKAKGPMRPGELLEVEIIGGRPPGGEWATIVADAPRFQVGEEVVLFATPGRNGHHYLAGFFQGAVRLQRTEGGGLALRNAPPEMLPDGNRVMHRADDLDPLTAPASLQAAGRDLAPLNPGAIVEPGAGPGQGRAIGRDGAAPGAQVSAAARLKLGDFLERVRGIHAVQSAPKEVGR